MVPGVESFHDRATGTVSHVVHAGKGADCAVIDPVLDYEPRAGRTGNESIDRLVHYVTHQALSLAWILETPVHSDHLSGAQRPKERCAGRRPTRPHPVTLPAKFASALTPPPSFF